MGVFFVHARYLCTWVEDQDALAAPRVGNNLLLYKIWVNILFFGICKCGLKWRWGGTGQLLER